MKHRIKYWLDEIITSDKVNENKKQKIESDDVDEIVSQINNWLNKIKVSDEIDEIIKQLEDWLDINNSKDLKDLDEIKNQINKIEYIKISDQVNKIINQLKECLDKLNDSGDASKIKKQFKDQLDKINVPDYVNKLIKFKIKRWLGEIKVSNKVNKIKKKQEISYWLDIIKGLDNMDEINKIKGSNDLDEIITQINDWLDKIDDIDKIKTQINCWIDKIKGLDNVDEITDQFLEFDKIIYDLPFNSPKHADHMYTSKIINTQEISEALTSKAIRSKLLNFNISDEYM
ncbi:hypothetical protein C2G38_2188731 [Gigaspora rosea]|uniref:Uncharacterized protein n=1 Tax=Gigaspora rosea TaxID=44941 RepID=A0A397V4F8_9GLOM|nr:hypothetical protein C2G38_2188731 [Gigaspora rosea]